MPELLGFVFVLALAAMLWGAPRAVEAAVCGGGSTTCTSSTSHSSHFAIGGASGAYLSQPSVLGALQRLSAGGLETVTLDHASTTVTTTTTFGPATILIGPDQSQTFFVAAGTTNVNTNTHFARFYIVNVSPESPAFAWITGDFHAAFQTALLEQN
ncbi:MAG: hypothetical protein JNM29_06455, partial [Candidatus Odyssella sp.]|nr:hypothetical protein [Candidatus Odyssella sp.]